MSLPWFPDLRIYLLVGQMPTLNKVKPLANREGPGDCPLETENGNYGSGDKITARQGFL